MCSDTFEGLVMWHAEVSLDVWQPKHFSVPYTIPGLDGGGGNRNSFLSLSASGGSNYSSFRSATTSHFAPLPLQAGLDQAGKTLM